VRLFFALLPDSETQQRITTAARELRLDPASPLVRPESLHMTLAFVGKVPALKVALLRKIGDAQRIPAFTIRFDEYEYWPKAKAVVAAARESPASLNLLWRQIHDALAKHNLAPTHDRLRPHVTLARKVSQAPVLQAMSAFDLRAQAFSLMHSDTTGVRPLYTVVDTWPLLDDGVAT
jgi:RNA 2',3'-cyclic 3'-phosphodiesterase